MPTPAEIITWHRDNYVSRLLARSPLLHFYPDNYRRQRIDLCDIFNAVLANAPTRQRTNNNVVTTPETLLRRLFSTEQSKILGLDTTTIALLDKIRSQAIDKKRMHGQHTLFVGYPLLFSSHPTSKTPILAPLFLIPIEVRVFPNSVNIKPTGEIRPNLMLQQWATLKQTPPVLLAIEQAVQEIENNIQGDTSTLIHDATRAALANWSAVEKLDDICLEQLDKLPSKQELDAWRDSKCPPTVLNSAILGIADFKGVSILDCLKELIDRANDKESLGIVDSFLTPVVEKDQTVITEPREIDKYFVRDTDPFQDQVLWLCRNNDITVIQGPPGTGKSQTIVNLVADALANNKRVGIFAQKRAALEIIHKRAVAEGFGELCLLIDDPQQDRGRIISNIKNITQDWPVDVNLDARRLKSARTIEILEGAIEYRLQAYRRPADGFPRYADLQSRLAKLNRKGLAQNRAWRTLVDAVKHIQPPDILALHTQIESYNNLSNQVLHCGYTDSPWRHHRIDRQFNRDEVSASLDNLFAYLNCRSTDPERSKLGDVGLGWLFTSGYFRPHPLGIFTLEQQDARNTLEMAIQALEFLATHLEQPDSSGWLDGLWSDSLDKEYFEALSEALPQAGNVTQTKKTLLGEDINKILEKEFLNVVDRWADIIEACIYENWLDILKARYDDGFIAIIDTQTDLKDLKENLLAKQQDDRSFIRCKFKHRVNSKNHLDRNNLLEVNNHGMVRKTELRDIYFRGFPQFAKLHPVLLTTPESACSILPMTKGLFDLVIFDEASQMFMAEAFPLLFRAKAVVVAGDSKQMPPADFFAATVNDVYDDFDGDDESDEDVDDATREDQRQLNIPAWGETCLLDAAENAVIGATGRRLLEIHYRSESHELIEFSNHAFYDGKLQYPPSNPSRQTILPQPIVYEAVQEGNFHNGTNQQECKHIVRRLKKIWSQPNPPTVGVIVLNVKQANLIEDELRSDGDLIDILNVQSNRKDEDEDVGFFVRSVEHVQGDERDLIIFGTTYSGIQRNFGPLTRNNKGRRRLNVAITRAKKGMLVVSSLDIDSMAAPHNLGNGDGKYLQYFLRYAQAISNGTDSGIVNQILDELNPNRKSKNSPQTYESFFEQDVAEFLIENKYDTVSQVGESGFRIDLAVINRNGIGYLCGIECDGAQYHTGWKVRSNDIWRQQVLESKGWKILRIWSTDWFNDCTLEKNRILDELKRLEAKNTFN